MVPKTSSDALKGAKSLEEKSLQTQCDDRDIFVTTGMLLGCQDKQSVIRSLFPSLY